MSDGAILAADTVTEPPRLHWVVVLLLNVLTLGLFGVAWLIVQGRWVRKVRGSSSAWICALAIPMSVPLLIVLLFPIYLIQGIMHVNLSEVSLTVLDVFRMSLLFLPSVTVLALRGEITALPIGLRLGWWRTLLFGTVYVQYGINRYRRRLRDQR